MGNGKKLLVYLQLAAAVICGCYLRLHNIENGGLWLDEAFSVAVSDPENGFLDVYQLTLSDVHSVCYQVVLWLFYKVFGYTEISGRYLSVFFGVLLIPSMFYSAKRFFEERAGLIAAWLTAINYFLIYYSQELRSYSMLVLLFVLSFMLFMTVIQRPTVWRLCLYGVVLGLLVNTHYFGFLALIAQGLLFFSLSEKARLEKNDYRNLFLVALFVVSTILPGFIYLWHNLENRMFWMPVPADDFFIRLFSKYFENLSLSVVFALFIGVGSLRCAKQAAGERSSKCFSYGHVFAFWCRTRDRFFFSRY